MQGMASSPTDRKGADLAAILAVAALGFLLMLRLFWVGFLGSDDESYWGGAGGWLAHFPYVGKDHWTLRHTLVVPMALARAVLGNSMAAMFLPTILYGMGMIVILGLWAWRSAGALAAACMLALVITNPQFVLLSSTADVDIPEVFFVVAAFFALDWVIGRAKAQGAQPARVSLSGLLLVGILEGLALLTRETAIFSVAAIGVLFLWGYGFGRLYYFIMGIGCALIVGLETLWLWNASGNWLYRSTIDVNHDATINRWLDQGAAIPFIHPLIDPFTMLLVNHNFGILAWIGVPLTIWLFAKHLFSGAAQRMAVLLSVLALVWMLLAAGLWKLLPLTPRYFFLPSVMICVPAGLALAKMWQLGRRKLAAVLGVLLLSGNLLALAADNRSFMFGVYTVTDLASRHNWLVHTDPQTSRRANLLLQWAGTREHVTPAPAQKGDLFFYNPTMAGPEFAPHADWVVIERHPIPESGGRWLACHLPAGLAPASMVAKFKCGSNAATLFRVT